MITPRQSGHSPLILVSISPVVSLTSVSDLVVLPLHDTYADLTKKLVKTLEFANKNFKFDFVLKCDDDTCRLSLGYGA